MDIRMSKKEKALAKLRENPKNVRFEEIDLILCNLNFKKRMKGSHATYTYPGISPIVIPFRTPYILPIYVQQVLEILDQIIDDN
jgi:hypothetical protein